MIPYNSIGFSTDLAIIKCHKQTTRTVDDREHTILSSFRARQ